MNTPHKHNANIQKAIIPALKFKDGENFEKWKERAKNKLTELLGLPFVKCEDKFHVEFTKEEENFTEIRFTFQSEEDYFVPCHLLIPKNTAKPLTTVICLQGHSTGMHISLGRAKFEGDQASISEGDRDFAIQAIKEGYCALTIEQRNFGECGGTPKGPDCYLSTMAALLIGRTTIGERVWDVSRAIDILEKHFNYACNTENIICMGNSGGGTATYYAACLEERIKYAMPSCAVCTYADSIVAINHCTCNFIPNICKYFEMGDLAGLIAPRKLVIVTGKEDPIFPLEGVKENYDIIQKMYIAANAKDNCKLVIGDGEHRFYADDAWPIMNDFILKN